MGLFSKELKCKKCKSLNIELIDDGKKGFSGGKALGGAFFLGPLGLLFGLGGKRGKKHFRCKDCGRVFTAKLK